MPSDITEKITLEKLTLSKEELRFTSSSGRYSVQFEHIEDTIFRTTVTGYYDLEAFYGHTFITNKIFFAIDKIAPHKKVYFIENITRLSWMTPEARKENIAIYKKWKQHGGSFVYGANKFLFSLNKILSSTDYSKKFHFCNSEQNALEKIKNIIGQNEIIQKENFQLSVSQQASLDLFDKSWEKEKETISVNGKQYRIINRNSWEFTSDIENFSFKTSLIEGNIFLMKFSGFQNQIDVDKIYKINNSIIKEFSFNTSDNKIFSVGDFLELKSVSLKSRKKNTDLEVEFRNYSNIFITVSSPTMKVLIKIQKTFFPSQYKLWKMSDSVDNALEYILRKHRIEGQDLHLRYIDGTASKKELSIPGNKRELRDLVIAQQKTISELEREKKETVDLALKCIGKISTGESFSKTQPVIDFSERKVDQEIFSAINLLWEDFTEIIKEKETALEELMESEQRFRMLFNSVPNISIQGYKTNGTVVYWNKASEKIYGFSREEAIGKNLCDLIIPDNFKNKFELYLEKAKGIEITGELSPPEELTLKDKAGGNVRVYSLHTIVKVKNLKPVIYCLDFDLSERYKAEEELKQAHDNLEKRVEERTTELIIAKNKAEESDQLKTAFLANMSHEIRTPLNAIMGFSGLLTPNLEKEILNNYINIINNSGAQLLSIINDIIDIAKIEAGQIKIENSECNLNSFLKELVTSKKQRFLEERIENKKIKLSLGNDDKNFTILTDCTRLKQVIINLVNNAIKFTEKGEIEFGYYGPGKTNNKKVQENELLFFVKDTGIGINIDQQEIIFERFRQVENSLTKRYGGTGLGLAISKSLVVKLGGRIWVESEVGKGSIFYFTLPHITQKEKKLKIAEKTIIPIKKGKTILIAEDEPSNYQILKILLSETKSKLIWARNGQEAIDMFTENKDTIDLILMDIQMPVKNGLVATREIKAIRKDIPILVQTAYALSGDKERFLDAGCDDYIAKPIEKNLLFEKIGRLLSS